MLNLNYQKIKEAGNFRSLKNVVKIKNQVKMTGTHITTAATFTKRQLLNQTWYVKCQIEECDSDN
jgi:hypothetical protein